MRTAVRHVAPARHNPALSPDPQPQPQPDQPQPHDQPQPGQQRPDQRRPHRAEVPPTPGCRPRNDPGQYDDLADEWWRPGGSFAVLHWLAAARAALVPPAPRPGAVLVDVGCGGGLLVPHVRGHGYTHVGVDLSRSGLRLAAEHGLRPVRADAGALPLASGCADVVVAGEILEHVDDLPAVVAECCRLLRPGGHLIVDTLNATGLSRLLTITVAERLPRVPRGIHDHRRYVRPADLIAHCAAHGVDLQVSGARPATWPTLRWLATGSAAGRFVPCRSTAVLYQGQGVRRAN